MLQFGAGFQLRRASQLKVRQRLQSFLSPQFYCFSKSSMANFTLCEKPRRPPDMKSMGMSEYWDEGAYVVRCSNHWSGRNGVEDIRDSYWTINYALKPDEFVSGKCYYDDFEQKRKRKKKRRPNRKRR